MRQMYIEALIVNVMDQELPVASVSGLASPTSIYACESGSSLHNLTILLTAVNAFVFVGSFSHLSCCSIQIFWVLFPLI